MGLDQHRHVRTRALVQPHQDWLSSYLFQWVIKEFCHSLKCLFPIYRQKIVLLTCFDVLEGIEDSGGSGLDEDEIAPAVERTPLRIGSRPLSSPVLVSHLCHQLFTWWAIIQITVTCQDHSPLLPTLSIPCPWPCLDQGLNLSRYPRYQDTILPESMERSLWLS